MAENTEPERNQAGGETNTPATRPTRRTAADVKATPVVSGPDAPDEADEAASGDTSASDGPAPRVGVRFRAPAWHTLVVPGDGDRPEYRIDDVGAGTVVLKKHADAVRDAALRAGVVLLEV